jgi:hypothetical protein
VIDWIRGAKLLCSSILLIWYDCVIVLQCFPFKNLREKSLIYNKGLRGCGCFLQRINFKEAIGCSEPNNSKQDVVED